MPEETPPTKITEDIEPTFGSIADDETVDPVLRDIAEGLREHETSSHLGETALAETDGVVVDNKPSTEPKDSRYQTRLKTILSTPLTVETIDTYAQTAVSDLINLTDNVVNEFADITSPDAFYADARELEDAAFRHFDLPSIPVNLDYIDQLDQEIRSIDTVIEEVRTKDQVIVPPDAHLQPIVPGNGEGIKEKELIPRLKTLLFILKEDYEIELTDPEQVRIAKGKTTDEMMRDEPYYSVEVPSLNRTVLVCDEEGNATFVIDTNRLRELEISTEQLLEMTKDELNAVIEENTGFGRRLIQSENWVDNISENLNEIQTNTSEPAIKPEKPRSYLTRKELEQLDPSEMLYSTGDLSSNEDKKGMFDVSYNTIYKIAKELGIEGQEIQFAGGSGVGYDSWQANQIRNELYRRNLIERKPEDRVYSTGDLSSNEDKKGMFDVSATTIRKISKDLGIEGQEVQFGSVSGIGYDSWQVNQIRNELYRRNLIERKPEDRVYSAADLGNNGDKKGMFDVSIITIRKIAKDLGIEGQEIQFAGGSGVGYDSWQVNQIRNELYRRNLIERKPEDRVYSTGDLSSNEDKKGMFDVSYNTIYKIAKELGIEGQEIQFGNGRGTGYDSWQVNQIRDELYKQNLIERKPEDRVYSAADLGNNGDKKGMFDVSHKTIRKIAKDLGIEGQEIQFAGGSGVGYDSWQVNQIRDELIKQGKINLNE